MSGRIPALLTWCPRKSNSGTPKVLLDVTKVRATQHLVHRPLKGLCSIAKAKGHVDEFIQPEQHGDGSLQNVSRLYWNLVKCPDEVNMCENGGTMQASSEVLQMGNGILIGDCDAVERPVIPPVPRGLLGDQVQRRAPVAGGWTDDAKLQHVLEFLSCNAKLFRGQTPSACCYWLPTSANVVGDSMLDRPVSEASLYQARELCRKGRGCQSPSGSMTSPTKENRKELPAP